ncbi:hypothetical protein ScPMuIL_004347 [Solemya velum]
MLTPAFHFRILNDFISVFNEQAAVMLKNLEKQVNGDTIDIFPFITMCALDIICGDTRRKEDFAKHRGRIQIRVQTSTLQAAKSAWLSWINAARYADDVQYLAFEAQEEVTFIFRRPQTPSKPCPAIQYRCPSKMFKKTSKRKMPKRYLVIVLTCPRKW